MSVPSNRVTYQKSVIGTSYIIRLVIDVKILSTTKILYGYTLLKVHPAMSNPHILETVLFTKGGNTYVKRAST